MSKRPECERLRAEVSELRRDLGYEVDANRAALLKAALGVTRQQSIVLTVLLRASGRPVANNTLYNAIEQFSAANCIDDLIKAHVWKLRDRLGWSAIGLNRGYGYFITDFGRDLIRQKCAAFADLGAAA